MSISYKKFFVLGILLLTSFRYSFAHPFAEAYRKECNNALHFYTKHKTLFEEAAQKTTFSPEFLFAIIAPELTQFSTIGNQAQVYTSKVFYVQNGNDYADFSIGYFQMKPSFIEQMEERLATNDKLKQVFSSCIIKNPHTRQARVERINRLSMLEWHLEYLALFCELVKEQFPSKQNLNEKDLLPFYATVYNAGLHKTEADIEEIMQVAQFPRFSRTKHNYGQISLWFYSSGNRFPPIRNTDRFTGY